MLWDSHHPLQWLLCMTLSGFQSSKVNWVESQQLTVTQGSQNTVEVTVRRDEGATGPVTVTFEDLPSGVTVLPSTLTPYASRGKVTVQAQAASPVQKRSSVDYLPLDSSGAPATPAQLVPGVNAATVVLSSGRHIQRAVVPVKIRPQSGTLESSFGKNGIQAGSLGTTMDAEVTTTALDEQGRVLIAGIEQDVAAVQRFTLDGRPDVTFGKEGMVRFVGWAGLTALTTDDQGGILAAVVRESDPGAIHVHRLLPNGDIDPAYGEKGIARVQLHRQTMGYAKQLIALPGGAVLINGIVVHEQSPEALDEPVTPLVVRLTPSGMRDSQFAEGGNTETPLSHGEINKLVLAPDGSVFGVGTTYQTDSLTQEVGPSMQFLIRYNSKDGSTDRSFGEGGTVVTPGTGGREAPAFLGQFHPEDLRVLDDGKIMVLSTRRSSGEGVVETILFRYRADGSVDTEFGQGGAVIVAEESVHVQGEALIATRDGWYVAARDEEKEGQVSKVVLRKLRPDGRPDPDFSFDGKVTLGGLPKLGGLYPLKGGLLLAITKGDLLTGESRFGEGNIDLIRVHQ